MSDDGNAEGHIEKNARLHILKITGMHGLVGGER